MRPQAVSRARRNIGNVIMEYITDAAAESNAANLSIMLEHAKFNRSGVR
jgi:hypothetical protein